MEIEDRKQKIIEMLHEKGKVKVAELEKIFEVSGVTIRIDLDDLESKGILQRVHGGAVISSYKPYYNMDFGQRMTTNKEEKMRIAEKAASMIKENDTVMFNSGTTTLLVFHALPKNMNLNILTNSVLIALEASDNPNFNAILLGGAVNPKYQFTYGDDACSQLDHYHAEKFILSVDGVDPSGVISTCYNTEAEIARKMFKNSDMAIVAADYTKIGRKGFTKISRLDRDDVIITNDCAPADDIAELKQCVNEIILI